MEKFYGIGAALEPRSRIVFDGPRYGLESEFFASEQIEALLAQANGVGVAAFPAAAHASLAQSYLRGRPGSDLRKRARITWAALTGRL